MSIRQIRNELELRLDQFCAENGRYEPDTNAFVFDSDSAASYVEGLSDAIETVEAYMEARPTAQNSSCVEEE